MRISILALAAIGLASTAAAQMPLPAFTNTFTGALTRGFWFQAPATALISGLSVPNEAGQPFQVVEVIDLGLVAPPAFPGLVTGTTLFYDNSTASGTIIPTAIPLVAGNFYGILGACNDVQGSATSFNSYGANGPFLSDFLGIPTTITRFGTQSGIAANGGGQPCWSEAAFNVSRIDVYLSNSGGGTIASNTNLGAGCYQSYTSFYENFASAAAVDIANSCITMTNTGSGYLVSSGGTLNAVGSLGTPTALALGDDTSVAAGTLGLTVHSNGFVSFGAGNGNGFTPAIATLLNDPATAVRCWHDFNPAAAGSGLVQYEESGTQAQITWDGVFDFAGSTPNTIQFQINTMSGDIVICLGTLSGGGNGYLVGYSPAGSSVDPGNSNLSDVRAGTSTILTGAADVIPLRLTASSRPVTGTNWNLAVSNSALLDLIILGLTDPNIPDLFLLGLPGCGLRASLDLIVVGSNLTVPIPSNPTLVGAQLFANGVSLAPTANAFGAITSNGIAGTIGDL